MTYIPFIKAVALGNDFIILDARETFPALTISELKVLMDRRFGIGCDQLIYLFPPTDHQADVRLQFYNADGTEASACGNGARCVARFLMEQEHYRELNLQTAGTIWQAFWADKNNGSNLNISVVLGKPLFDWDHIPLASPEAYKEVCYNKTTPICVNVGNPHAMFFVNEIESIPLDSVGPEIENHKAFPERINVGFVQIINSNTLKLRVWERGAGYTMACGTGACAAAVAAIHQKLISSNQSPVRIIQDGGEIDVAWREEGAIMMTGPAQIIFKGEIKLRESA